MAAMDMKQNCITVTLCIFADNTQAVLAFANEAHQLVSDALAELVEVIVIMC